MSPTTQQPADLYTIGDIAERFGVSEGQAKYAVASAHVDPAGRVGIIRYWRADQLPAVEAAIRRTARARQPIPA